MTTKCTNDIQISPIVRHLFWKIHLEKAIKAKGLWATNFTMNSQNIQFHLVPTRLHISGSLLRFSTKQKQKSRNCITVYLQNRPLPLKCLNIVRLVGNFIWDEVMAEKNWQDIFRQEMSLGQKQMTLSCRSPLRQSGKVHIFVCFFL